MLTKNIPSAMSDKEASMNFAIAIAKCLKVPSLLELFQVVPSIMGRLYQTFIRKDL